MAHVSEAPPKAVHTIDSVALGLLEDMKKNEIPKLEAQIGLQKICILGNHKLKKEMEEIANRLCNADYPATIISKLPDEKFLSDFQKEISVIKRAALLVVIDSNEGGLASESTYLMMNKNNIAKSILLVPAGLPDEKLYCTKGHYVYYPIKIQYPEGGLIDIAVRAARQASHRLALYELGEVEGKDKN